MGGRGSKSGGIAGNGGSNSQPQTVQGMAQTLKNKFGVTVGVNNMSKIDQTAAMAALNSVNDLLTEFPRAIGVLKKITAHTGLGKREYAHATYYGDVVLNQVAFQNPSQLNNYGSPKGTSYLNVADHEIGHILEKALITEAVKNGSLGAWGAGGAWANCTFATKVIHEAAMGLKKTAYGNGKTIDQLVRRVSQYATTDRSEAMAECVSDYRANGSNANPLSIEVWNILKRELG